MEKSSAQMQAAHDDIVDDFNGIISKLHKRIEELNKLLKERTATSSPRSIQDANENEHLPLSKQLNQGYLDTDLSITQIHSEIVEPLDNSANIELDNLRIEMKTLNLKLKLGEGKMIILKREKEQIQQILENQKEMLIESQRINQMLLKKYREAENKLHTNFVVEVEQKEEEYGNFNGEDVNEMKEGDNALFSRIVGRNGGGKSFSPFKGSNAKSITDPVQIKQLYEQALQLSEQNSRLSATLSNFENFYHLTSDTN